MSRKARFEGDEEEEPDDVAKDLEAVVEKDLLKLDWPELHASAMSLNQEIMECLKRGDNDEAYEKLLRAQDVLAQAERVCPPQAGSEFSCARAAIASSFAICHKRADNYPMAVRFLETALDLYEEAEADLRTLMAARLNLAACFAEAEMPEEALQHSLAAVALGGQLITQGCQPENEGDKTSADNTPRRTPTQESSQPPPTIRPDDYAMLAVAYHKTAEAHEHMKQWGQATLAYTQAYEVVRRSLGPYHQLTKSFEKSARCPRKPAPPQVPLSWRGAAACKKLQQLQLPQVERTMTNKQPRRGVAEMRGGVAKEPLGYELNPRSFPSWPPKAVSEEERSWYTMAMQERRQKKFAVVNQIRDLKWTGGSTR